MVSGQLPSEYLISIINIVFVAAEWNGIGARRSRTIGPQPVGEEAKCARVCAKVVNGQTALSSTLRDGSVVWIKSMTVIIVTKCYFCCSAHGEGQKYTNNDA